MGGDGCHDGGGGGGGCEEVTSGSGEEGRRGRERGRGGGVRRCLERRSACCRCYDGGWEGHFTLSFAETSGVRGGGRGGGGEEGGGLSLSIRGTQSLHYQLLSLGHRVLCALHAWREGKRIIQTP